MPRLGRAYALVSAGAVAFVLALAALGAANVIALFAFPWARAAACFQGALAFLVVAIAFRWPTRIHTTDRLALVMSVAALAGIPISALLWGLSIAPAVSIPLATALAAVTAGVCVRGGGRWPMANFLANWVLVILLGAGVGAMLDATFFRQPLPFGMPGRWLAFLGALFGVFLWPMVRLVRIKPPERPEVYSLVAFCTMFTGLASTLRFDAMEAALLALLSAPVWALLGRRLEAFVCHRIAHSAS